MTIEELRARGLEVKISHRRPLRGTAPKEVVYPPKEYPVFTPHQVKQLAEEMPQASIFVQGFDPHGGRTTVTIIDGEEFVQATALCRPDDTFCRKIGREIAFGRALKIYQQTREMVAA